jgi:hypothetical protein
MHDRDRLATSPRERSVAVVLTKGAVDVSLMEAGGPARQVVRLETREGQA